MDIDTPDSRRRGGSVLSIDDPDVRIAAEALGDLRAGTFERNAVSSFTNTIFRLYTISPTTK
jgi:hypothetical protein